MMNLQVAVCRQVGRKRPNRAAAVGAAVGGFLAAPFLSGEAAAGRYQAGSETELVQAVVRANLDGDDNARITLTRDIALTHPTVLPTARKPITVDTGPFSLAAARADAAHAGLGPVLGGGAYTLIGTIRGGDASHARADGRGGMALVAQGGELANRAGITAGSGAGSAAIAGGVRQAGAGGIGVAASNVVLHNHADARIAGGLGGHYDAVEPDGAGRAAGGGGTGLLGHGGHLHNEGIVLGGDGGDATNSIGGMTPVPSGRGGEGLQLTGGSHANHGVIAGGNGGVGASAQRTGNGAGGHGVQFTGAMFHNQGLLRGGHGGISAGTAAQDAVVAGGAGGHGVIMEYGNLVNGPNGVIEGGDNPGRGMAAPKPGGSGVVARSSSIINSGHIAGGRNAGGYSRAAAIEFGGANNVLELRDGWRITGRVSGSGRDTLVLSGTQDNSFAVSHIAGPGKAAQFEGFARFELLGAGTWRLHGVTTATTPWMVHEGTLDIEHDASLGHSAGALTFAGGTLRISGTRLLRLDRPIHWSDKGGGLDIAEPGHRFTIAQDLHGGGSLHKRGPGTLVLAGSNTYTGGTTVSDGTLRIGDGGARGHIEGNVRNESLLAFDRSDAVVFPGRISGTGSVVQLGRGATTFTADHTYTGVTVVSRGTLKLGDGGTSGHVQGDIYSDGQLVFDRADAMVLAQGIHGRASGAVVQAGTGTTVLAGTNDYQGPTDIRRGILVVNGDQADATGAVTVRRGAMLQGHGRIGGTVTVQDGGTLAPGYPVGMLATGSLTLHPGAALQMHIGRAAPGRLVNAHDRIRVDGDLTLDGFLDIATPPGGSLDVGVYRLIDYRGRLTDRAIDIRDIPASTDRAALSVQATVPGQVNLLNTGGRAVRFWQGSGPAQGDAVRGKAGMPGGDGVWRAGGPPIWSDGRTPAGMGWVPGAVAVFLGEAGTIRVDDGGGPVVFGGVQFAAGGYAITGPGALTTGAAPAELRVGDGTPAGQAMRATIETRIQGQGALVKSDLGTLVLAGDNRHAGGTMLRAGTLEIARDANLGKASGPLTLAGGRLRTTAPLDTARRITLAAAGGAVDTMRHTVRLRGPLTGAGDLVKEGSGTLEFAGASTARGTVTLAAGRVRAGNPAALGAALRYAVRPGATLDLAGHDQAIAGLDNAGMVAMGSAWAAPAPATRDMPDMPGPPGMSGSPATPGTPAPPVAPGTTLTVRGDYIGRNGTLLMRTVLGDEHSATDRLVIDGGRASGRTIVQVVNAGGLGARTRGDGIELIRAINGATTTAQTTRDAFVLANDHVDAGAYEYRLYPGDATGAGENWYLRSTAPAPALPSGAAGPGGAGPLAAAGQAGVAARAPSPQRTAYRPEVALNAALPAVLAHGDMAVLGTLHRREGDGTVAHARDHEAPGRRAWGRVIDQDAAIRQSGTVSPRSDGWFTGLQLGVDVHADGRHRVGIYGATLGWRSKVRGDAGGATDAAAGHLSGRGNYAGLYWTYMPAGGWYSDVVLQYGRQRGGASTSGGGSADVRAQGMLASAEVGVPFRLGDRWQIEPQAQLIAARQRVDDVRIPAATLQQRPGTVLTTRLGLRLKGDYAAGAGRIQPYSRLNLWQGFSGQDTLAVRGPAGQTDIETRRGHTSADIAAGGTWAVNRHIALYGELGHTSALGGAQRVSTQHSISMGLRIAW
jgi:outer membrane autotransporter protein